MLCLAGKEAEAEAAFTNTLTLDNLKFLQHVFFSSGLNVANAQCRNL